MTWIDIDNVESPNDDLRFQGWGKGAARFTRGEGMWYGNDAVYFACTNGGRGQHGQIWEYVPSPFEGTSEEEKDPGRLELFVEPDDKAVIDRADNLVVAPWGDIYICEDGSEGDNLVGVTPEGEIFRFAENNYSTSELAGATRVLEPAGRVTKLLAGGYDSRDAAQSACNALKRSGQDCLVTR